MKTKSILTLIAIVMILTTVTACNRRKETIAPQTTAPEESTTAIESVFEFENGVITKYNGTETVVAIPSQIHGQQVTEIGEDAFGYKQLTGVTIPNGITKIGSWAFRSNQLTSITIPDSVTFIGYGAFRDNRLTGVTIPDSVTIIDGLAFEDNPLVNVTIGTNVELGMGIEGGFLSAFDDSFDDAYNRGRLAGTYILDNGIWSLKGNQQQADASPFRFSDGVIRYYNGTEDTVVEIPSQLQGQAVTTIGYESFYGRQLTGVIIPDSVTAIQWDAFAENNLTSVTIPDSVTIIGGRAFSGNQLTDIIIPNSVIEIEESAFGDNQLTNITIPDSVKKIGPLAFGTKLNSITIGANVELGGYSDSGYGPFDTFNDGFDTVYNNGGKQAGTYLLNNGVWIKQ